MRRDHEASLNAALDELFLRGATSILRENLYLWYNAARLSRRAYRNILDRWQGLCEEYGYADDIPEIEVVKWSRAWLNLRRKAFQDEKLIPLAELAYRDDSEE